MKLRVHPVVTSLRHGTLFLLLSVSDILQSVARQAMLQRAASVC